VTLRISLAGCVGREVWRLHSARPTPDSTVARNLAVRSALGAFESPAINARTVNRIVRRTQDPIRQPFMGAIEGEKQ